MTATSKPEVVWEMGNGETETCIGPGTEWLPGMAETDTDCSYTYTRASVGEPGDAYEIQAGVTWEFSWTINGAPQGTFGTYQALTPFSYQVGEIQAVAANNP